MNPEEKPASENGSTQEGLSGLSTHILPTSATMFGVCITVVSLVRLIETNTRIATYIDQLVAVDSLMFLLAAFISYLSMRTRWRTRQLENIADVIFMLALTVLAVAGCLTAWELGGK